MFLPLYNVVLILVIFLGFVAYHVLPAGSNPRFALLNLIQVSYGGVAQGLAYSTIALASLIPCSIMSIGASNLCANHIYRDLINPNVSAAKLTLVTRSMVFVVIGLALLFGMLYPTALVSLQLLGVSIGLATTFTVYGTGTSFGIYEGFWGLCANLLSIIVLNPFFAAKTKQQTNRVKEYLFDSSTQNIEIKKGA